MQNVQPGSTGVSKSNVSRLWQQAGLKFVNEFRERDLSQQNWVGLMLRYSFEQRSVGSGGLANYRRRLQDFELGSSESAEVSKNLMRRLQKRGFDCKHLFVTLVHLRPLF